MVEGIAKPISDTTLAESVPQKPNCDEAASALASVAVLTPVPPGSTLQNAIKSAICPGVSQWWSVITSCSSNACALTLPPMPKKPTWRKLRRKKRNNIEPEYMEKELGRYWSRLNFSDEN